MKVLITGGSGFVGHGIIAALLEASHEVHCLLRQGFESKMKKMFLKADHLHLHTGDIFAIDSLRAAMRDCDAVIHLVGIIREQAGKEITFSRIHVEGTRNVLQVAKELAIHRFIFMSALGTRPQAVSGYHQTKYEAEQLVKASGIPYVIFRPSVIFGPGDEFVTMLADLVRLPFTPVIGSGTYLLQPVSRKTVAEVFTQALTSELATNQIYEVGGPHQLSYMQILRHIGHAIGKSHVRTLHVPLWMMKPIVTMMQGFSFFPITTTQLTMLQEGNFCEDGEKLYQDFQINKIEFSSGISEYLSQTGTKNQIN
ncbi:NAD-dependent nucleoside diphosphate-sugar epimerase/dehydratase [Brevibacillus halotolerans]|uniref:complex I NDUFA9 subunit family protein n=1 Tax=Brevibacillus halotolerans TaxID=1507437 RepID=UPI001B23861E|nr:complex I NDUFA9 subunit family protein [Brevibacillus halotolerans]GIO03937.1 NAD-dependent nucleoside diphosphate-sugar epimerase/dehydratase [Brevibacillus halotolerans]